jgi:hypothetical protein
MPKDCEHEKWCKWHFKEEMPIEKIEELYKFLQGEVPECLSMKRPPHLSGKMAFRIIYYLQEVMGVIPDKFERCSTCGDIYNSEAEGSSKTLHCDCCRRD